MGKSKKNPAPATSAAALDQAASTSTPAPAGTRPPGPVKPIQTADGLPTLEPWMKQTVVLQLKEVDGRVPDMTPEIFGKKMILEQGFSKAETLSVQTFIKGIFYITFVSLQVCRRYWEMVRTSGPDSPFRNFVANSPIQRDERRVTVSMRNPHSPGKDIATYLQRFCIVVKDPVRILDYNGFWTGKWFVSCRLRRDASGDLQHLQTRFSLGASAGLLHYADQPRICHRCGQQGHVGTECATLACRFCRVVGHETKDCPRSKTCNLCGLAEHVYRNCPQRTRTYAGILAKDPPRPETRSKPAREKPKEPRKTTGKSSPPQPTAPASGPPPPTHPEPEATLPPPPPTPPAPDLPSPTPPVPDLSSLKDFPALSTPTSGPTGSRKRKPESPATEEPTTSTKRPIVDQHNFAGDEEDPILEDMESEGEEEEEVRTNPETDPSIDLKEILEEFNLIYHQLWQCLFSGFATCLTYQEGVLSPWVWGECGSGTSPQVSSTLSPPHPVY